MELLFLYSWRNLWARRATTLATALGIGLVVFILSASLMLSEGIQRTLLDAGSEDKALVLQTDAYNEAGSQLRQSAVSIIAAAPGVRTGPNGQALVVAEAVGNVFLGKEADPNDFASIQVRGVTPDSYLLRPQVRVVAGRLPKAGTTEAMLGRPLLSGSYAGVRLGGGVALEKDRLVQIVGVFEANKTAYESEIWADIDVVRDAFGAAGYVSSVTAQLESPESFTAFRQTLEADKRQGLSVERERAYYEKVSNALSTSIRTLGMLVSIIFSLGAALGAAITMYGHVAQRRTEVGVLQALGFGQVRVLLAFLGEAVLLATAGGLLGLGLACLTPFLDFSVVNWASGQSLMFHFVPSPRNLAVGLGVGVAVGVLGGLFPAIGASRLKPVTAMRRR